MKYSRQLMALSAIISLILGGAPLLATSKGQPAWKLPDHAVQVSEDVYYLGEKIDPQSHKRVEGFAFVHRSDAARGNGNAKKGPSACYSYLGGGAKWKSVENWVMNTSNARGLNGATVFNLESNGIAKWEDATDGNPSNGSGINIMGSGSTTNADLSVGTGTMNGANEVYFGAIGGAGSTIAVTTIWGIFGGPTQNRVLSEWDQVYDDVDFDWSTTGAAGKMDFENVAVHEIGHAVGMGHSGSTCQLETMYAYADNGETMKRDLHTGDINGINALY